MTESEDIERGVTVIAFRCALRAPHKRRIGGKLRKRPIRRR